MKTAFVSGPYRAAAPHGVYDNIQRARKVAERLWRMGYAVFCPHMNTAFLDGLVPDDTFLDACLAWLPHADIVVMIDGWEESLGARAEMAMALTLGIPVYGEGNVPEVCE